MLLGGEWRGIKMACVFHGRRLSVACDDRRQVTGRSPCFDNTFDSIHFSLVSIFVMILTKSLGNVLI